jgi:hypothetical protein
MKDCQFCGHEVKDDALFCPFCGKKLSVSSETENIEPMGNLNVNSVNKMIPNNVYLESKYSINALGIVSIIGCGIAILFYILSCANDITTIAFMAFFGLGYAIAQSIVSLISGLRHKKYVIAIMAVIGFVWYTISFMFLMFGVAILEGAKHVLSINFVMRLWFTLAEIYALTCSIVSLLISLRYTRKGR